MKPCLFEGSSRTTVYRRGSRGGPAVEISKTLTNRRQIGEVIVILGLLSCRSSSSSSSSIIIITTRLGQWIGDGDGNDGGNWIMVEMVEMAEMVETVERVETL